MALKKVPKKEKKKEKMEVTGQEGLEMKEENLVDDKKIQGRFSELEKDEKEDEFPTWEEEKKENVEIPQIMPLVEINPDLNYKRDVMIDLDHLDFEWARQSQLVSDYGDIATYLDEVKRKLERTIAIKKGKLDPDIRKELDKKDQKITEGLVKSMVEERAAKITENEALDKILSQISTVKTALNALDHKKKSLEWLSQLYVSGYFATPSEKRMTEKSKKITEILNARMEKVQRDKLNNKGE